MSIESNAVRKMQYLQYLPSEYEKVDKWPLIISLHGSGERGSDISLLQRFGIQHRIANDNLFPFIVLCPQCPENCIWEMQFDLITELLENAKSELKVDESKVILTGYSMGGYGVWNYAMLFPNRFTAIVPVSGGGMIEKKVKVLKDLPIWTFHGVNDKSVPIEETQKLVDILRANNSNVKFSIYQDCGHEVCTTAYDNDELYDWLLSL
jgi:predicted peptidase